MARTKIGKKPLKVESGKMRSSDGRWQYRSKECDVNQNHIHLEKMNPLTGEVLENWHLKWPQGGGR